MSRTDEHVIADNAIADVSTVFTRCGWACETVVKDYGEDLFVQTTLNGKLDPNRLWVQVKGTRSIEKYRKPDGSLAFYVSPEHAYRWIRSLDPVIFVLWDVDKGIGYWTLPVAHVGYWDLLTQDVKMVVLPFEQDAVFDVKQANFIAWWARMRFYVSLLSVADNDFRERLIHVDSEDESGVESIVRDFNKNRRPLICFDFLRLLGIVGEGSVNAQFLKWYSAGKHNMQKEHPSIRLDELRHQSAYLSILATMDSLCPGMGVSAVLLQGCSDTLMYFLAELHPEIY